jgi:hypothetical protein
MKYGIMTVILLLALPACCLRKEGKRNNQRKARVVKPRTMMQPMPMQDQPMIDEDIDLTSEMSE